MCQGWSNGLMGILIPDCHLSGCCCHSKTCLQKWPLLLVLSRLGDGSGSSDHFLKVFKILPFPSVLSHSVSLCLSVCLSISVPVFFSFSVPTNTCLCACLCASLSFSTVYLCLYLSLSLHVCFFLHTSLCKEEQMYICEVKWLEFFQTA